MYATKPIKKSMKDCTGVAKFSIKIAITRAMMYGMYAFILSLLEVCRVSMLHILLFVCTRSTHLCIHPTNGMGTCAYAIKPAGNGFQRGRVFGKVTLTDERSMSGKFTTPHSAHCALFDFIEKSVAHFCALTE